MARTAERAQAQLQQSSTKELVVRTALVAVVDALGVLALVSLASQELWTLFVLLLGALLAINWAYLNPRAVASRWLTPGLVLMGIFVVYPVLYTSYVSFTNWQTGNVLTKDQAVQQLESRTVRTEESGALTTLSVYADGDDLALLVAAEGLEPFLGIPRAADNLDGDPQPAADLTDIEIDPADPPATLGDYELVPRLGVTRLANRLTNATIDLPDGGAARVETLTSARLVTGGQRFVYDVTTDTLYDAGNDRTCVAGEGNFVCAEVPRAEVATVYVNSESTGITCVDEVCSDVPLYAIDGSLPGWRQVIGPDNYVDIVTNQAIRAPFLRVLVWNIVFAILSVAMTFALGLALALTLKDESMRGRAVYRSIYILPYAIPGFLSILVWAGLLNANYGKVNDLLGTFGIPPVEWLTQGRNAMISVLLVNLWLGFPYMFLISSGALTSIPEDLLEAAKVDGAGPWRVFRSVTLPLLLVSTAPLLIGSFAFNFNNFILIYLLTDGGPPLTGYDVPVGSTDLLISFTFKLASASGRGAQFGTSSAIVVLIFLVLATTSGLSFRLTKKLEEIYDQG